MKRRLLTLSIRKDTIYPVLDFSCFGGFIQFLACMNNHQFEDYSLERRVEQA